MTGADVAPADRTRPRPLRRAGRWIAANRGLAVVLAVPFVVFFIPRLFGLVYLNGDNFIQNFPMRVLVGWDLDHGSLPLWNPYLFSGTPLLGGFNAGAAYPATWLMAVLDDFTAWALTLAVAYDVAVVGMYLFLRRQSLATTAALFGAVTYSFSGFLVGQLVHIDLIESAIWLPWMLLAVQGLTEPSGPSAPAGIRSRPRRLWVAVLAGAFGLSILSGGVEAIIDGLIIVVIYWVNRLVTAGWLSRDRRRQLGSQLLTMVTALVVGAALGCAQWLPGLTFSGQSQRAIPTYTFFTSGSLQERLFTVLVSPFVMGTNHGWPGAYIGGYNFPEVTSYVGILALIAACSLFLRRWRRRPEARNWWIWYGILVLGVLSALGDQTPFGRVLFLLPGVDKQRLLNRNLLLLDLALAVLLAWWIHLLLEDRTKREPAPSTVRDRWHRGPRSEIVVTCLPFALVAGICAFLWIDGPLLYRLLEVDQHVTTATRVAVAGLVTVLAVVAGAATWIALHQDRYGRDGLRRRLVAVLAVDLVLFNFFVISPPITEAAAKAQNPTSASLVSQVGDGRFIIYDPDQFDTAALFTLGQTDLNIFNRLPSAQGYAALVDGSFYRTTGAHLQETLDPATLGGSVWDGLNVTTLLSLPSYFVTRVPSSSSEPTVPGGQIVPFPSGPGPFPVPRGPDSFSLRAGQIHRWYFGGVLTVDHLTLPIDSDRAAGLELGLVTPTGTVHWLPPGRAVSRTVEGGAARQVTFASPVPAAGLVVRAGPTGTTVGVPTMVTAEAGEVSLDGRMQSYVVPPHWTFTGTLAGFGVFRNSRPSGWARLRSTGGGPASTGNTFDAGAPGQDGSQRITVHTTGPVVLQRSVAWTTGWQATVTPATSSGTTSTAPATTVPVVQDGVIQQVRLPAAGDFVVNFTYAPAAAIWGIVVSGATAAAVAIWVMAEGVAAYRRRGRTGSSRRSPPGVTPG